MQSPAPELLISAQPGYFLSTMLKVKVLTEYDYQNKQLGHNLRFRYHKMEGSDLYIVLNENLNTNILPGILTPQLQVPD